MRIAHQWVVPGTIVSSLILALFSFIVTAGAAPLDQVSAPVASAGAGVSQPAAVSAAQPVGQENPQEPSSEPVKPGKKCAVSEKYPQSVRQWCNLITRYARQHGLDANLVAAVMLQESGGQPLAYSKSGAVGLMQVMPRDGIAASFMCVNGPCFANRPTIEELQDPAFNIEYGTRMLAGLENRLGSLREALKSYGPKDVGYYYADIVLAIYQRYQ